MTHADDGTQSQTIKDEILELERRLEDAKARLNAARDEESAVLGPDTPVVKGDSISAGRETRLMIYRFCRPFS
jgi:hypothetical protein